MRKIREVLRLKHEQGLTHRAVAQACSIGVGTVTLYLRRAAALGLGWPVPAAQDDAALEARLFPRAAPVRDRIRPDCGWIHRELKRVGVTLQLLWEEYAQVHPDGYRYSQFCEIYRQWARRLRPSMRQVHRAGEKTLPRKNEVQRDATPASEGGNYLEASVDGTGGLLHGLFEPPARRCAETVRVGTRNWGQLWGQL